MAWITPVTNRENGAQYSLEDINRVGTDVQHLSDLLNGYGYSVTVNPKTDWAQTDAPDRPNQTDMTTYLADVAAIKMAFYGTQTIPAVMDKMFPEDANNIEKLLVEVEGYINNMVAAFWYSGEIYSGEA